ncbi:MAG: outer membrane beta-barrel protein [Verrucomicrobiaceae bacterium]|nr:outer membrane beta-barrel protein [Verrucomicrobiaceae bacterium]
MRTRHFTLFLAVLALSPAALQAQGLTAIQNYSADFRTEQPLTFSIFSNGGYDTMSFKDPTMSVNDIESWYVQGGVGVTYTRPDQTTPFSFSLDSSVVHYIDGVPRFDSTFYNNRATINFEHRFSERLKISNNFYATYGVEPNNAFGYGASTTIWNGHYLYGYNNFNVSYAWSPRFSTTTSYTIDGIGYQDDIIATPEDRYTHLFAQQFAYALDRQTSLTAEYRYRMTTFDKTPNKNFNSHFALAGVDHAWSERFSGSVRGGAEFYDSDATSNVAPYAEAALNYAVARETMVRWFASLGYNGAELAAFTSRYGVNTGLQLNHNITKRLSVNAGANYAYSEFDNLGGADATEHSLFLSTGLGYNVLENLRLDAQYSFSMLQSNDVLREFDRHRVSLGATASF